jgi:hypothetical protein
MRLLIAIGLAIVVSGLLFQSVVAASGWTTQPVMPPALALTGDLMAVSCANTSSCMAVGAHEDGLGLRVPMAEVFNGANWSLVPTPQRMVRVQVRCRALRAVA